MKTIIYLLAALLSSAISAAADGIRVEHAASHSMVPGAKVGDGYLVITNDGGEADRLISAASPRAANVQLHKMTTSNGVMIMRDVKDGLPIPPHSTVNLEPDYHLMFNGVEHPFKQGEKIEATLTFEKAGVVAVSFAVGRIAGPLDSSDPQPHAMNMPGMDMHAMQQPMQEDPAKAIPDVLKAMFEVPEKPLAIDPVVVESDWAVAGWQQDGRGGRVLLRSSDHGWQVHALGGESLRTAPGLETGGVPAQTAGQLAAKLSDAEAALNMEAVKALGSFEGMVMLATSTAEAGHTNHEGH
ncbi:copper chaperone PCu(A)C [Neorhizobium lilium]|uniref:Copper chaperone PCu(A)C n=1 Tax=Neorhizobium lilium TaxID=2503024 RepID=A0A3S3SAG8_9HYPH|nr:copper uptake system-associated protein [Neorhizobium lilium]RWX81028.1 copper chaperone PCu(A)C [Neorhizobium lilium]